LNLKSARDDDEGVKSAVKQSINWRVPEVVGRGACVDFYVCEEVKFNLLTLIKYILFTYMHKRICVKLLILIS